MHRSIIFFLFFILLPRVYALELYTNKDIYTPDDTLVVFGNTIPNDSIIVELFNPTGNLIYRTQLDANGKGEFASILFKFPNPDSEKFRLGTYTLIAVSSIDKVNASKIFVYQLKQLEEVKSDLNLRLNLDLFVPAIASKHGIPVIAYVTLNDAPLLNPDSVTFELGYPDGKSVTLNYTSTNGIYKASFDTEQVGYHYISVKVRYHDIVASKLAIINVFDDSSRILNSIDSKLNNLTATSYLDSKKLSMIQDDMEKVSNSISQFTSLLLPILGIIIVILLIEAVLLVRYRIAVK